MSRLVKVSLKILLVCMISMAQASHVKAMPPLPSSFYGTVKMNGQNIPDGTLVRALIDGQAFASGTTQIFEGESVYFLDIPGDDTDTVQKDGGQNQETVHFEVGGALADQEGTWISGTNVALELTVTTAALEQEDAASAAQSEHTEEPVGANAATQPVLATPSLSLTASPSTTEQAYAPQQTIKQAYPVGGSLDQSTSKPTTLTDAPAVENAAEDAILNSYRKKLAAGGTIIIIILLAWIAAGKVRANKRNSMPVK